MATYLQKIRDLARNQTSSLNVTQMSDATLDTFIDAAYTFDFPEELRLAGLRTNLTFYTQPGVDVYETNTTDPLNPLYDFKNRYTAVHPTVYIAGIPVFYTQDESIFYGYYPKTNSMEDTLLRGNGAAGVFTGAIVAHPIIQGSQLFTCLDTSGTAMTIIDYPVSNVLGALGIPNQPQVLPSPYGQINYATGQFTLNFNGNTQPGAPIYSENVAYVPGKPISMLYYDTKFTLRPVPNNQYRVQIEVDAVPSQLFLQNRPEFAQWWQYIGYLTAKKIFEWRRDYDSLEKMMPTLDEQKRFVLRPTLMLAANQRTTTIYTTGASYSWGIYSYQGWPY
jgi:hypothetical protein